MSAGIGVYVHIPFCASKCLYCDFTSFAGREESREAYKNALLREISGSGELAGRTIRTMYIGGGTPTALPASWLAEILEALARFRLAEGAEITVEANPGTLNAETLRTLKAAGVNRLSVGLQAWQNGLLETLGRAHTAQMFEESYNAAVRAGFRNINVDVMFALPGQAMEDWLETLEKASALEPAHISAYGLTVEEGTPFGRLAREGRLRTPGEEEDRAMYAAAKGALARKGYEHYEISNFARPDLFCRHNVSYWEREEYAGFGLAAHSFTDGARRANTGDLGAYIRADGDRLALRADMTKLDLRQAMEEFMFLGLRLMRGVEESRFRAEFGRELMDVFGEPVEELARAGLLTRRNGRIALTARGIDVSNIVFSEFVF